MRVVAVCQDELVIRTLNDVLQPSFDVEFLLEAGPLARRLHDAGLPIRTGDPRRVDTYLKADISPTTCFVSTFRIRAAGDTINRCAKVAAASAFTSSGMA